MRRLSLPCSNRQEEHRHLWMSAHVLQPLHPDGGRNDQRPRVGVEVIQNHWESDWRAVGSHAGELTRERFLNGMIHPIRQLFHTFPTFLSSFCLSSLFLACHSSRPATLLVRGNTSLYAISCSWLIPKCHWAEAFRVLPQVPRRFGSRHSHYRDHPVSYGPTRRRASCKMFRLAFSSRSPV